MGKRHILKSSLTTKLKKTTKNFSRFGVIIWRRKQKTVQQYINTALEDVLFDRITAARNQNLLLSKNKSLKIWD